MVVPVGVSGFAPGAFCHHGTTAQRLKRWIVGRWVELSQGAGILGESEGFLCFFCWGGWNIQQRFTKKQQGTNKNSGTIIGFLKVELMSLWKSQMVSAQGERNYGNLKVQGCSMLVFFYFVEQRRNGPMTFYASWGSVLNRELVSKDGLSFLLCMCFTYFLAVGRQVKIFGEVSTTRSIIVMF